MVDKVQGKLYRFAFHFLNDIQEAEDVVQEALSRIWEKRNQVDQVGSIEAYMMTMVRNLSLDRAKAKQRVQMVPTINSEVEEDSKELESRITRIRLEIRNLPDSYRSAIHLRDIEGSSYEEISDILGLSLSDVKVRIHRGRKILRDKILNSHEV